jgi:hypothetical protein
LRRLIAASPREALNVRGVRTHAGYVARNKYGFTLAGVGVELLVGATLVRDARPTAEFLSAWALAHQYLSWVWTGWVARGGSVGPPSMCGPGRPWYGGQRASQQGCSQQPERLAARDFATGQSSSQLVEGASSTFFIHRLHPFPKGRDSSAPPRCTTLPR